MNWSEPRFAEATGSSVLRSKRFAGDTSRAAAAAGRLRLGARGTAPRPAPVLSSGPAIAKVQAALIDLRPGGNDGKFGPEAGRAVVKFKQDHRIRPSDPVVGRLTIAALDGTIVALESRTLLTAADVRDFRAVAKSWERPGDFGLTIESHRIGIDKLVLAAKRPSSAFDTFAPLLTVLSVSGTGAKDRLMSDLIVDPEGTCAQCTASATSHEAVEAISIGSM